MILVTSYEVSVDRYLRCLSTYPDDRTVQLTVAHRRNRPKTLAKNRNKPAGGFLNGYFSFYVELSAIIRDYKVGRLTRLDDVRLYIIARCPLD